jgi:hypothetical protein
MNLLRTNLRARLPFLLSAVIAVGCLLFSVVAIIPQWLAHDSLNTDIEAGKQAVAATATALSQSDNIDVLQRQIEGQQSKLQAASNQFLTQTQVDDLLRQLYDYANQSGAKIISLQAQQAPAQQAPVAKNAVAAPFDTAVFQLQVTGTLIQVMNMVVLVREASTPSVTLANINLTRAEGQYKLSFNVVVRTSPYATGKAFDNVDTQSTPVLIAEAVTATPIPATPIPVTQPPTATMANSDPATTGAVSTSDANPVAGATTVLPVSTASFSTPVIVQAQTCDAKNIIPMRALYFSQIQQDSNSCDTQRWTFKIDKAMSYVMDIVRRSGSGLYRIELHDAEDKLVVATLSSVDGRGILVANTAPGNYSLNIVPIMATGTWTYDIAIWPGLPAISFSWAQNSFSSHSTTDAKSNTMIWRYVLTGAAKPYKINIIRTDGNLEYSVEVRDASDKPVATAQSDRGNAIVNLTGGAGVYYLHMTTADNTTGSYRIALTR